MVIQESMIVSAVNSVVIRTVLYFSDCAQKLNLNKINSWQIFDFIISLHQIDDGGKMICNFLTHTASKLVKRKINVRPQSRGA